MLFETLKQSYIFLGSLYFGLICGLFKDFNIFILKILKSNKIANIILDILFSTIFALLFILCLNIVNFGEFRIYILLSYIFGYAIERKTLGFLVDFILKKIYNFFRKIFICFSKSKLIKRIFYNDRKERKKLN